jgi:hypothetical protein
MTSSVETVWPAKEARLAEVRRVPEHGHDDIVFPCASIYVDFLAARSKARDGALLLCRSRICSNLSPSHNMARLPGLSSTGSPQGGDGPPEFLFRLGLHVQGEELGHARVKCVAIEVKSLHMCHASGQRGLYDDALCRGHRCVNDSIRACGPRSAVFNA